MSGPCLHLHAQLEKRMRALRCSSDLASFLGVHRAMICAHVSTVETRNQSSRRWDESNSTTRSFLQERYVATIESELRKEILQGRRVDCKCHTEHTTTQGSGEFVSEACSMGEINAHRLTATGALATKQHLCHIYALYFF